MESQGIMKDKTPLPWRNFRYVHVKGTITQQWDAETYLREAASGMEGYSVMAKAEFLVAAADEMKRLKVGWQPIATAPRDGTEVLICWFNGVQSYQVERAFWMGTAWGNDYQKFTEREGWSPTHWQPVPDPPSLTNVG